MSHKTTTRILALIAKEICHGRPLWALLWANRYFPPDSLVRKALLKKATAVIDRTRLNKSIEQITQRIIAGETLATLPPQTTRLIARVERVNAISRPRKVPPVFYRQGVIASTSGETNFARATPIRPVRKHSYASIPNSRLSSIVRS